MCVSKISTFGRRHTSGKDVMMPTASEQTKDYEWNCPFNGKWDGYRFSIGAEQNQCARPEDCLCISRGSNSMHTVLDKGVEKIIGRFQYHDEGTGAEVKMKDDLTVVPHYSLRKIPAAFDPQAPDPPIGKVKNLPRDAWLPEYKTRAPRIQLALDKLVQTLKADLAVENPDATQVQGISNRVQKFETLSDDCMDMRDTVRKLAARPEDLVFDGKYEGAELKCYIKKKVGAMRPPCDMLNCYRGAEDEEFLQGLTNMLQKVQPQPTANTSEQATSEQAVDPSVENAQTDQGQPGPTKTASCGLLLFPRKPIRRTRLTSSTCGSRARRLERCQSFLCTARANGQKVHPDNNTVHQTTIRQLSRRSESCNCKGHPRLDL